MHIFPFCSHLGFISSGILNICCHEALSKWLNSTLEQKLQVPNISQKLLHSKQSFGIQVNFCRLAQNYSDS